MARKKVDADIVFVVTLDDGSEHWINIDTFTLRSGDAVARTIAREWQAGGRIPPGKIASVRRLSRGLD